MDSINFLPALASSAVLPAPALQQAALHLGWALLLGAALLRCLAGQRRNLRLAALGLLALWVLLPGPLAPGFWLGLAWQTPSLMSMALGARYVWQQLRGANPPAAAPACDGRADWLVLAGALLGALLLADTLALLPAGVYAWGFGQSALMVLALGWVLALVAARRLASGSANVYLCGLVLLLFVLTRLPTGNLWDALLDPWLWLVLVGCSVRRLLAALTWGASRG